MFSIFSVRLIYLWDGSWSDAVDFSSQWFFKVRLLSFLKAFKMILCSLFFMGYALSVDCPTWFNCFLRHILLGFCFINLRAFLDSLITGFWKFRLVFRGHYLYAVKNILVLIFHACFWVILLTSEWSWVNFFGFDSELTFQTQQNLLKCYRNVFDFQINQNALKGFLSSFSLTCFSVFLELHYS